MNSKNSDIKYEYYIRTILLIISYLNLGLNSEIIGPTMRILAYNTHVTFNGIGTALAFRSAGSLLGNITCGIFQKLIKHHSDLLLTISFIMGAILISTTPYISSLMILGVVFFLQGIFGSFINMSSTNLVFEMWKTHSAISLNLVHLGYGCGAIFANLLVRPFLNKENIHLNLSEQLNSTSLNTEIRIPYTIIGGISLVTSIGHLIFFLHGRKNKINQIETEEKVNRTSSKIENRDDKMKYSPTTCGYGHFGYGLALSFVFTIYMFFVAGTDQTFAKFYFSYLRFDKFHISSNGASWGIILFWISFSTGRLFGAIVSIFISAYICLIITWCSGLLLAIMWIVYVWIIGLTATNLFVLGSFTGLIIGPLYPLSFGWINQKLNVIPMLLAAILCGCGLGSLTLQKIAGFVMDRDPYHFPTLLTICVIVTIILYIIASFIVFFHQRNLKKPDDLSLRIDEDQELAVCLQNINETL